MKKLLTAFFVVIFCVVDSYSQNVPDYKAIEREISDAKSPYYYPVLMDRYQKNDTTLNHNDYFHLYYGYVFQEEYKPMLQTNYVDSLAMVFSARRMIRGDEFSKIERYAKAILSVEPFNLRDINVLAYAYQQIGYHDKAVEQNHKFNMILEVIRSSGTGLEKESPWYIIYLEDANDFLNVMGAEPNRYVDVTKEVQFVGCRNTPEKRIKGYYFNHAPIYFRTDYMDGIELPKRKMKINPVPKN